MEKSSKLKGFFNLLWVKKRPFTVFLLSVIVLFMESISLNAQVMQTSQKISPDFKEVSLLTALHEINQLSGNLVNFQEEVVVRETKRITLQRTNISVLEAVQICLENTKLVCREENGKILVAPRSEDPFILLKGYVYDVNKQPLPGVTIQIKGTSQGSATDMNGYFAFRLPMESGQLIFSFIGFKSQTVNFDRKIAEETLNITLLEDVQAMDEVIVTGYQNIREESFTGSFTKVTREELLKVSPNNVLKALQAFEPSFKVIANNEMGSDPNTMQEYYIRGRSGISEIKELDRATSEDISEFALKNNPSAPVFIMDGFEVDMEKVYDLDPNRIETITILKDAAATAVYGSRAANGVIVITTLAPQAGEIRVNYSGTFSLTAPDLSSYDLLNAEEALLAEYYAGLYTGNTDDIKIAGMINYDKQKNYLIQGINTDWMAIPLQLQTNHSHSFGLSGGTKELRWGLNASYRHNGGVMKKSFRDTYGVGLTVHYNYRDKLQVQNRISIDLQSGENSPYGSFADYVKMKPYFTPYNPESGSPYKSFRIYRKYIDSYTEIANPIYEASLGSFSKNEYKSIMDQLSLTWYINPFTSLRGSFSASYKITDTERFVDPASSSFFEAENTLKGTYSTGETRYMNWSAMVTFSYMQQLGDHNLNFSTTVQATEAKNEQLSIAYQGFAEGTTPTPSSAIEVTNKPVYRDANSRSFGGVLQFNYSLKDIYLFDLSGRLEGNSNFGAKKKVGGFWSTGIGLNIHNYDYIKNLNFIDRFKLSATYGETGKANFSPYQARSAYEMNYDDPYAYLAGMGLKALGNENLKWEKVRTWNVSGDLNFLEGLFSLRLDYYHSTTVDQVTSVTIPSSTGFKSYMSNMGEILNEGIDVVFRTKAVDYNGLLVYLSANMNRNRNVITKIGRALEDYNNRINEYYAKYNNNPTADEYAKPFTKYEVGNSLSAIYGMRSLGINPQNGQEIFLKRDGEMTYDWSAAEQCCLGDRDPEFSGTLGLNVSWKGLSLYTTFAYQWGGQAYNATMQNIENMTVARNNGDRRILTERWKKVGDVTTLKSIADAGNTTRPTSRFVQDENMLRFSSLSLGYSFDQKLVNRIGLSTLRMQFNMSDIATISTVKQERGTEYPFARTFNFTLNATF